MFNTHSQQSNAWRQVTLAKPAHGLQNGLENGFDYSPIRSGPFYKESELT